MKKFDFSVMYYPKFFIISAMRCLKTPVIFFVNNLKRLSNNKTVFRKIIKDSIYMNNKNYLHRIIEILN